MENKSEIITKFIEKYGDGPQQLSSQWFLDRKWSIGGSTLSSYLGINPYSNVCELLFSKITGTQKIPPINSSWGILFEPIICTIVEYKLKIEILGENMFIKSEKQNIHYSPDGISLSEDGKDIVLHEFKCPIRRQLTNSIPSYYKPQILLGMEICEIVDYALFTEAVFRIASFAQMKMSCSKDYNTSLLQKTKKCEPLYAGLIIFKGINCDDTLDEDIIKYLKEERLESYGKYTDIGSGQLDKLLPMFVDGVNTSIDYIITKKGYKNIDSIIAKTLDEVDVPVYGFVCWKLFDIKLKRENKISGYLESNMTKLGPILDLLKECSLMENDPKSQEQKIIEYCKSYYDM